MLFSSLFQEKAFRRSRQGEAGGRRRRGQHPSRSEEAYQERQGQDSPEGGGRLEAGLLLSALPALLRLELQPEPPPQVRVQQGERLRVRQVRQEVSPQAELRLPPEAEAQDHLRDD